MCYAFNAGIIYTHMFYANISHSFLKMLYEYYDFLCATDFGHTYFLWCLCVHVCVWCVVCGVWCVVCGVWCVVCVCVFVCVCVRALLKLTWKGKHKSHNGFF